MSTPLDDRRRIEDLERIAGELRQQVRTAWTTRSRAQKHIRIGITAKAYADDYPTAPCTVYPVKFVDAAAPGTQGLQAIDAVARTNTRVHYAATFTATTYLPEGTAVALFWDRGVNWPEDGVEWWIIEPGATAAEEIILFELTSPLANGGKAKARKLQRAAPEDDVFEMVGPEFWVNDFRFKIPEMCGKYVATTGYRGVASNPSVFHQLASEELELLEEYRVEWQIVEVEQVAEVIRGTLAADAELEDPLDPTEGYRSDSSVVNYWWNGRSPGTTQNIYDPAGLFKRAREGAKYLARRNDKAIESTTPAGTPDGKYELVECQSLAGWIAFTLIQPRFDGTGISSAGNHRARVDHYWGSQQDIQDPATLGDLSDEVDIYFEAHEFRFSPVGAKGYACYDAESDRYYPVICDQIPIYISGEVNAAMCNSVFTYLNIKKESAYPFGATIPGTTPIRNPYEHRAPAGYRFRADWSAEEKRYEVVSVKKREFNLLLDVRHRFASGGDTCPVIEGNFLTAAVESCGSAAWSSTTLQVESQTIVENVATASTPYVPEIPEGTYDEFMEPIPPAAAIPGTCKLRQVKRQICTFPTQQTGIGYDVFSFVAVPVVSSIHEESDGIYQTTTWVWAGPCDAAAPDNDDLVIDVGPCGESGGE